MVKPSEQALDFLAREFGVFFHFGIRTFNEDNRDWDGKSMSVSTFNPAELDCEQWIKSIKEIGAKYAVLTSKHHDGFALWPSKYTEYCIKNTPYKNGKGDVIREFTDACRKYGIGIGIYYSCAQADTKDMTSEKYNDFVAGQLYELLDGTYGKIDEIWFDSCGSQDFNFDADRMENIIRKLQPEALVFGQWGQDINWVGNESGFAMFDNTNNGMYKGKEKFIPVECDCTMVRKGYENFWFYNETHHKYQRDVDELVGMYYNTVGRGANLLLNVAPNRKGLLCEDELATLNKASKEIKRRLCDSKVPVDKIYECEIDGKQTFVLIFNNDVIINHLELSENLADGERIKDFTITSYHHTAMESEGAMLYIGKTVGHKRLCTFPPIRSSAIRIVIENSDGKAKLDRIIPSYI